MLTPAELSYSLSSLGTFCSMEYAADSVSRPLLPFRTFPALYFANNAASAVLGPPCPCLAFFLWWDNRQGIQGEREWASPALSDVAKYLPNSFGAISTSTAGRASVLSLHTLGLVWCHPAGVKWHLIHRMVSLSRVNVRLC